MKNTSIYTYLIHIKTHSKYVLFMRLCRIYYTYVWWSYPYQYRRHCYLQQLAICAYNTYRYLLSYYSNQINHKLPHIGIGTYLRIYRYAVVHTRILCTSIGPLWLHIVSMAIFGCKCTHRRTLKSNKEVFFSLFLFSIIVYAKVVKFCILILPVGKLILEIHSYACCD